MAITAGTRIGAYEVTSQLGEGGMGVVFRARDTKLLRDVAVKVLPDHFADDGDRLSRLQREAQLLASLNHPNIAQIYGLEQLGGSGCIVMELVEGETLGDRLKNGPLPVDEAIEVAKQIADALAAAHERGIIHRDLKPANIKLTPSGTVKVLDFGLAKAMAIRSQATELSAMPTMVSGSVAGMVVGTAAYMSPEQARGKDVDARTDIWAFGCVLFEMLTGKQAFEGETFTDIAARIVSGQPDMDLLPASLPHSIRLLLDSTLNKNQNQRLQHIADMRLFLDQKLFPPAAAAATAAHENTSNRGKFWIAAFAILLIAALVPTAIYFRRPSQQGVPMRFEIALPVIPGGQFNVSPDGARLAYVAQPPNENRAIWIRPIGSETAQKLTDTENASGVAWSPDSRYVAFVVDDKLKKIDVVSGAIQTICDIKGRVLGFTWNRNGVMLLANDSRIIRVSDAGGEVKTQVALDPARKDQQVALPVFLPDGNHFLYVAVSSVQDNSGFYVGSLDPKPPKRLMPLGTRVAGMAYSPQGYIIIAGQTLTAYQFDLSRLEIQGQPVQLAETADSFSVSDTGLLLFRKAVIVQQNKELTWFNRSGEAMGRVGTPANYGDVELSPKAERVAVDMVSNQNRDVWAIDIARNVTSRITSDAAADWSPLWSPDESQLIFASSRGGANHIYRKSSTGVGEEEMVSPNDSNQIPVNWSPDGRYIVFSRLRPAGSNIGGVDTWVMENFGDKKATPFMESQFDKAQARISPDGRFLAYATNDSGIYQVVVQTFPDPNGAKWQITAQGGVEPKWRRDGRELYYLGLDGKLMGVQVKPDHTFGTPAVLFQTPLTLVRNQSPRDRRYDVAPDGRFLLAVPVTGNTEPTIVAAINWAAGLREKK